MPTKRASGGGLAPLRRPASRTGRRAITLVVAAAAATLAALGFASPALAMTHDQAMFGLYVNTIAVSSSGGCSDRGNPSCTSFEGVRDDTINGIITLRRASGCPIVVTAGTEAGHAGGTYSHWNGYKLDIAHNGCIDGYITGRFAFVADIPGFGRQYRSPSGNLYTNEGSHWDILYYNCGGC